MEFGGYVENQGYIMGGLSLLLIIPSILLLIVLTDVYKSGEYHNTPIKSDNAFHTLGDVDRNIPDVASQILAETSQEVVKTGHPISNSRQIIKVRIQSKIDNLTDKIQENTGSTVKCDIRSVSTDPDPFKIDVNSTIFIQKDHVVYNRSVSHKISISSTNSSEISRRDRRIQDPLPFTKCHKFGGTKIGNGRVVLHVKTGDVIDKISEVGKLEPLSLVLYINSARPG